jgi:molybdopterin-guanine dinucleotide biosynthesis protein A
MGRDKLSLKLGDLTLLERVHAALSARCGEVLAVGPSPTARETPPGVRLVPDLRPGRGGPLFGLEAALTAARHPRVVLAAGDMPFLTGELVGYLLALLDGSTPAAVPRFGGREHPLCAAYDARLVLRTLREAIDGGERAARAFVGNLDGVRYVDETELSLFGDPEVLLMNVNTPADLARARALAGS